MPFDGLPQGLLSDMAKLRVALGVAWLEEGKRVSIEVTWDHGA